MSVLACDRNGCENIMCDRHSPEHGYICDECFEELVQTGMKPQYFMVTKKQPDLLGCVKRDFYEGVFPIMNRS